MPNLYDWALSTGNAMPRWKGGISTTWTQVDNAVNLPVNDVGPISLQRVYDGVMKYAQSFCAYGTAQTTDAAPDCNTSIPLYQSHYPDCAVKEWVTVGVNYTYKGFEHGNMRASIQNLFDTKAPYNADLHNAYGRYFKVSARYTF